MKITLIGSACAAIALSAGAASAQDSDVSACLITKTDTNPFFVKMREGAEAAVEKLGVGRCRIVKAGEVNGRPDGWQGCDAKDANDAAENGWDIKAMIGELR